jgi:hypothetical protein
MRGLYIAAAMKRFFDSDALVNSRRRRRATARARA